MVAIGIEKLGINNMSTMIPPVSSFEKKEGFPLDFHFDNGALCSQELLHKAYDLSRRIFSLSFPFKDKAGRQIQLWSVPKRGLIGTVVDCHNKMSIVNPSKIHNGLNPSEIGEPLYQKLLTSANHKWDLVFLPNTGDIHVWPHLVAAGKGNPSPIWVETSPLIGSNAREIARMLLNKGYAGKPSERHALMGIGSYVRRDSGRTFRFDRYGHGAFPDEPSHMDVFLKGPDGKTIKRRFAFDNMPGGDGPVIKKKTRTNGNYRDGHKRFIRPQQVPQNHNKIP
ncbi:MAG: hypothetical protein ACI9S8_003079 [Chlamydiales bacterium]|jgi:hypothetical protein